MAIYKDGRDSDDSLPVYSSLYWHNINKQQRQQQPTRTKMNASNLLPTENEMCKKGKHKAKSSK